MPEKSVSSKSGGKQTARTSSAISNRNNPSNPGMKGKRKKPGAESKSKENRSQGTVQKTSNASERKRKTSGKNSQPQGAKQRKRKTSDENDSYHQVAISDKATSKWIPLQPGTLEFLSEIMRSNKSLVLSRTSAQCFENVQNHLSTLENRITTSVSTLKVPATKLGDYRQLHTNMAWLENILEKTNQKIEGLEEEIEEQEKRNEEVEDTIAKLKEFDEEESDEEIHPLLRAEGPNLSIPSFPTSLNNSEGSILQTSFPATENHLAEFLAQLAKVSDAL